MSNLISELEAKAKADVKSMLHDLGHPVWAVEQFVKTIEAWIDAKLGKTTAPAATPADPTTGATHGQP